MVDRSIFFFHNSAIIVCTNEHFESTTPMLSTRESTLESVCTIVQPARVFISFVIQLACGLFIMLFLNCAYSFSIACHLVQLLI